MSSDLAQPAKSTSSQYGSSQAATDGDAAQVSEPQSQPSGASQPSRPSRSVAAKATREARKAEAAAGARKKAEAKARREERERKRREAGQAAREAACEHVLRLSLRCPECWMAFGAAESDLGTDHAPSPEQVVMVLEAARKLAAAFGIEGGGS